MLRGTVADIEDSSRVTAGPPSFDDCGRTVKISVSWKCYGTASAHMLGKIWVEIYLTLAALQIYPKNGRAHFEDNVSKNLSKNHAKNRKKTKKIKVWRVFWEVWGPSWSHVEQAWPQKRKNAHQKSPNWPNLVASWRSSWG